MAHFSYPETPPISTPEDAGFSFGTLMSEGSAFPTEYIDFLKITAVKISYDKGVVFSNAGAAAAKAVSANSAIGDSVYLYMPSNLTASYMASYSNIAFGAGGKMAAEMLGKSGTNVVAEIQAAAGASAPEALFGSLAKGVDGLSGTLGIGGAIGSASNLSAISQGKIFNPFEEQIFTGVSFRSHPFSWKLVAKNKKEAENIHNIIKFFKINMLPNYSDSTLIPASALSTSTQQAGTTTNAAAAGAVPGAPAANPGRYLTVPNRFRIEMVRIFYTKGTGNFSGAVDLGPKVYKFKDCLLESFNVGYTPDGQYTSTRDAYVPAIQIDTTFKETAYVTAEDASGGY